MPNVVHHGLGWFEKMVPRRGLEPPQKHVKDEYKQYVIDAPAFRAPPTLHADSCRCSIGSVLI